MWIRPRLDLLRQLLLVLPEPDQVAVDREHQTVLIRYADAGAWEQAWGICSTTYGSMVDALTYGTDVRTFRLAGIIIGGPLPGEQVVGSRLRVVAGGVA